MATLDEVISQMSEEDYFGDPIQFVIDNDLRIISIPRKGVVAGVVGDKNVNRINFQMPRYYNGFDMSKFDTRINYVNANAVSNFYVVDDLMVENDTLFFTWLIDSDVVDYVGKVIFSVNMVTSDENGVIKQAFNTSNAGQLKVLDGVRSDKHITPEEQIDVLNKLEKEVTKYINATINDATQNAMAEAKKDIDIYVQNKHESLKGNVFFAAFKVVHGRLKMYSDPTIDKVNFRRTGSRLKYRLKI